MIMTVIFIFEVSIEIPDLRLHQFIFGAVIESSKNNRKEVPQRQTQLRMLV